MLLEACDIRKVYPAPGRFFPFRRGLTPSPALQDVTLKLSPGAVTGLAGPNGAGKSTLLRILAGRLIPDGGHISIDGRPTGGAGLRRAAALASAAARSFYPRLSALENLFFFGELYGFRRSETRDRIGPLRDLFSLGAAEMEARFEAMSDGTAQKISLIRALMRRTGLLLLDEPCKNLDLGSASALSGYLKNAAAANGVAVFYASHNPAELAGTCQRVVALKGGRLAYDSGTSDPARILDAAARACAGGL